MTARKPSSAVSEARHRTLKIIARKGDIWLGDDRKMLSQVTRWPTASRLFQCGEAGVEVLETTAVNAYAYSF